MIISISWLMVLIWMAVIFKLSSQSGQQSNGLSMGVTGIVGKVLAKVTFKAHVDMSKFNHMARKYAHFFTYLVLGILVMNAIRRSGIVGSVMLIVSIGICILYAISDEVHQLFVPGRGAQVRDVLIDSAGASVGISIYSLIVWVSES